MRIIKTKIDGPLLIETKIYKDNRGHLKETFRNNFFK